MADAPKRVVSMNLCTDQLAMLLAAPGQLVSVSHLADDPQTSAMVDEAKRYPRNHGGAEEIYLMRPDLVLAGSYGGPPVAMLDRLGVKVVMLAPPQSLEDVREAILTVGEALGRDEAAAEMLAAFDARLAALPPPEAKPLLAATWAPSGYSVGSGTLAGDVLTTAGFDLVTDRLGMHGSGNVPLEALVMAQPDLIVTGTRYPGASVADDLVTHPVLSSLDAKPIKVADANWTCPLPQVLDVLEQLTALREDME